MFIHYIYNHVSNVVTIVGPRGSEGGEREERWGE
jgi:hypothetical protein